MSSFALFFGTIVFAINIVDSFIQGLGAAAEDRLVWSPDMIGCLLFLISGFLAMREIGPGRLFWSRRRDLGWWIVSVNQLGSALFLVAAIASFVRPSSGDELAVGIANWGTLTGALCFAIAGVMQEFERPAHGRLGLARRSLGVAGPVAALAVEARLVGDHRPEQDVDDRDDRDRRDLDRRPGPGSAARSPARGAGG